MSGEFTGGLFSPFIVPVAGTIMIFGIVAVSKWSEYNTRKLQYDERMAAIAKGLPMPEPVFVPREQKRTSLKQRNINIRLAGTICAVGAIGVATFFFLLYLIIGQREILSGAAAAVVPFSIGAGLLVDARINSRSLDDEPLSLDRRIDGAV